jgi:hypothetical protein
MNDIEDDLPNIVERPVDKFCEYNCIISEKLKSQRHVSSVKSTLILQVKKNVIGLNMLRFKNTLVRLKTFL